jgi:hypothetical protein
MTAAERQRPRISRETRLLLGIVCLSVATLWVLARLRFPDRPPTPNPMPPVLAQLAPSSPFDVIAGAVTDLQPRVAPSLAAADLDGTIHTALRSGDLAVTVARSAPQRVLLDGREVPVLARDPASGLTVVRLSETVERPRTAPVPIDSPRFLIAANSVGTQAIAMRPVFVSAMRALVTPIWSAALVALPDSADFTEGTFIFTVEGALVGAVVNAANGRAIVPADVLLATAERLAERDEWRPGTLGIEAQPLTPSLRAAARAGRGVVVTWVDPDGPAATELRATDIIEQVDGQPLTTWEHWLARVARLPEGDTIALTVRRGDHTRVATLTAAPSRAAPGTPALGLTLRSIPDVGSTVLAVAQGSAGAAAGLQTSDVITIFGDVAAPTAGQIQRAYGAADPGRPLLVGVTRGEAHLVLSLEARQDTR